MTTAKYLMMEGLAAEALRLGADEVIISAVTVRVPAARMADANVSCGGIGRTWQSGEIQLPLNAPTAPLLVRSHLL